jgi:hypothetical protein
MRKRRFPVGDKEMDVEIGLRWEVENERQARGNCVADLGALL